MQLYKVNLISRLEFNIEEIDYASAERKAIDIAGPEYKAEGKPGERFFYISYNGLDAMDGKTIIGHLAFSHMGFPSMLYITEQLVPSQVKKKYRSIEDVVLSFFHEFQSERDFDDFTVGRNMNDQLGDIIRQN